MYSIITSVYKSSQILCFFLGSHLRVTLKTQRKVKVLAGPLLTSVYPHPNKHTLHNTSVCHPNTQQPPNDRIMDMTIVSPKCSRSCLAVSSAMCWSRKFLNVHKSKQINHASTISYKADTLSCVIEFCSLLLKWLNSVKINDDCHIHVLHNPLTKTNPHCYNKAFKLASQQRIAWQNCNQTVVSFSRKQKNKPTAMFILERCLLH